MARATRSIPIIKAASRISTFSRWLILRTSWKALTKISRSFLFTSSSVQKKFFHLQPSGVIKSARPVRHSNHLDPDVGQFFCDHSADVSEALDCSRAFAEIYTQMFRRFDSRIDDAAACRFLSSQSAADGH